MSCLVMSGVTTLFTCSITGVLLYPEIEYRRMYAEVFIPGLCYMKNIRLNVKLIFYVRKHNSAKMFASVTRANSYFCLFLSFIILTMQYIFIVYYQLAS